MREPNANRAALPSPRGYESVEEIIAAARASGWTISRGQLERWHRAGVLPRPQQVGLGRGAGSETRYPVGTSARCIAACELRQRHRSMQRVVWELWVSGYDVPEDVIRELVMSVARWHDRLVRLVRAFGFTRPIVPERGLALIERLARHRMRAHGVTGMKRRLGHTQRLETVMRAIAQVTTGAYDAGFQVAMHDEPTRDGGRGVAGTDSDGLLVERAAGLARARRDRLVGAGPWLTDDPTTALTEVARFIGGMWLPEVERASCGDLHAVRDQARELQGLFVSFGDVVREHFGSDAFGFPAIADALRAPTLFQVVAFAILLLRANHDDTVRSGIAELRKVGRTWCTDVRPKVEVLRALRREVPAFDTLLTPRRMGDAMRDDAAQVAFLAELRLVAEANRPRVKAVMTSLGFSANG